MLDLKDLCILRIVKSIKDGRLDLLNSDNIIPLDLVEYLLTMLQKIEKWPLNNQFLEYLSLYSIETLDLSNQESINLVNWSNFLDSFVNNNNNENNNCNNSNIRNSLNQLSLSGMSDLTDQVLTCLLAHFNNLNSLKISHCTQLDGSFMSNWDEQILKSLEYLNVRGCTLINSDQFIHFNKCINLKELVLSKTNITNEDLSMLYFMRELQSIRLNKCHAISSDGIQCISTLPKLRQLYLSHCTLLQEENSIKSLAYNKTIKVLDLSFCFIDDASIGQTLFTMSALQMIAIRYNRLTPSFMLSLSTSPLKNQIKSLDLRESNSLTEESALCIYPAPQLSELYITTYNRRTKVSQETKCIDLEELYKSFNGLSINVNQQNLNYSSLRNSIIEKQEHYPLILLGEDEKFQARMVKSVLERRNFDVRIATDGKSAFEMFCETPWFVLVMMDIFMPILDGLSSIRMIREFEKSTNRKRTPIIICSGNESTLRSNESNKRYTTEKDETGSTGGDVFLSKPFRPNLVELILKMTTNTQISN